MPLLPLLVTSALALSQAPEDRLEGLDVALPDRVLFDAPDDGAHWALGHTYKARLDASGLEYVPYLGADFAGHASARFALGSLTAEGEAVELEPPILRRDGTSLLLDRGPLVERYAFALDSVEQILEIDLDGLAGELRVEFLVDTDLVRPARASAPFTFGTPGASIDVGAAYVVRRDGSKRPVRSTRTPGGYEIVVPADVVAAAGDSLVIDPVFSSGTLLDNPPRPIVDVDAASIGSLNFFVVVERPFNATDSDVFVYHVTGPPGSPASFVATIDFTTENWESPAIAGVDATDDLMVVASRGLGSARRIHARRTNASGTSVGTPFQVSEDPFEAFDPDIGAETGGQFLLRRFLVVWNDIAGAQGDCVVRAIDRNGIASSTDVLDGPNLDSSIPAVSNGSGEIGIGDPQVFRVALKGSNANGESIWAADFDRDGQEITPLWRVAGCENTQRVSVAGSNASRLPDGSSPYVVAWDSGPVGNGDIHAATCADGSVRGAISNLSVLADDRRELDQRRPAIAATATQYLISYQERGTFGPWSTYMCSGAPAPASFGLTERSVPLGTAPAADQRFPAIVSYYEGALGGIPGELGFTAWINASGATSLEGADLATNPRPAGVQYCEANVNSAGRRAWLTVFGDGSVSSLQTIQCIDAPPGVPCFFLTARGSNFVPNLANSAGNLCLSGLGFGRFSNQVALTTSFGTYWMVLDPQQIAQPTGTVAASVGETWYFQAWYRDAAQGAATSNLSNGVAVEFR